MIKRQYFISTKCGKDDRSGSYSYDWSLFTMTSLLPDHTNAFERAIKDAVKRYEAKGLDEKFLEIISFNRV